MRPSEMWDVHLFSSYCRVSRRQAQSCRTLHCLPHKVCRVQLMWVQPVTMPSSLCLICCYSYCTWVVSEELGIVSEERSACPLCLHWALLSCPLRWMEACLEEDLPPTTELEEGLRNGVYLGKLATFFAPKMVSEKRIYDRDQSRYKVYIYILWWLGWLLTGLGGKNVIMYWGVKLVNVSQNQWFHTRCHIFVYWIFLFLPSEQRTAFQTHGQHSSVAQSHGVSGSPKGRGISHTHLTSTNPQ